LSRRFVSTSALTSNGTNSRQGCIPKGAWEAMGDPDRIAWFVDDETGRVYVVPESEVTME